MISCTFITLKRIPNLVKKKKKTNIHLDMVTKEARGFPESSVGQESVCSAGDPGSTPGSRRSTGEGIGYPLQYSWASLVAQLLKNLPTMRETWVQSLGWEDPL